MPKLAPDTNQVDLSGVAPSEIVYKTDDLEWKMCADQGDNHILFLAEDSSCDNRLVFYNLCTESLSKDKVVLVKLGIRDTLKEEK